MNKTPRAISRIKNACSDESHSPGARRENLGFEDTSVNLVGITPPGLYDLVASKTFPLSLIVTLTSRPLPSCDGSGEIYVSLYSLWTPRAISEYNSVNSAEDGANAYLPPVRLANSNSQSVTASFPRATV